MADLVQREHVLAVLAEPVQLTSLGLGQNLGRIGNIDQVDGVDVGQLVLRMAFIHAIVILVAGEGHGVVGYIVGEDVRAGALSVVPVGLLRLRQLIPLRTADVDLGIEQLSQGNGVGHTLVEGKYHGVLVGGLDAGEHVQGAGPVVLSLHLGVAIQPQQAGIGPHHVFGHKLAAVVGRALLEVYIVPEGNGQGAGRLIKHAGVRSQLAGHIFHGDLAGAEVVCLGVVQAPVDDPQRLIPEGELVLVHHGGVKVIVELRIVNSGGAAVLGFVRHRLGGLGAGGGRAGGAGVLAGRRAGGAVTAAGGQGKHHSRGKKQEYDLFHVGTSLKFCHGHRRKRLE